MEPFTPEEFGAKGDGVTDDAPAIQAMVEAAVEAAKEDLVSAVMEFDGKKRYLLGSGGGIALTPKLEGTLWFRGNGCLILLSAECSRFLDCPPGEGNTVYDGVVIEDFKIDAAEVSKEGHVIFGNVLGGSYSKYTSFVDVTIRRVNAFNVSSSTTQRRAGIWIVPKQENERKEEEEKGNRTIAERILVEDVHIEGGLTGIYVAGDIGKEGKTGQLGNVWIDDVTYRRCWHRVALSPISEVTQKSSNFGLGGRSIGGRGLISECFGEMSGDVGIETNGMTDMVVEKCVIVDAKNPCFTTVSHGEPAHPEAQRTAYIACAAKRYQQTAGGESGKGYSTENGSGFHPSPVYYENCTFFSNVATPMNTGSDAFSIHAQTPLVSIRGCRGVVEGVKKTTAGTIGPTLIWIDTEAVTQVLVKDLYLRYSGERSEAAGLMNLTGILINTKEALLDIDDVRFAYNVVGGTTGAKMISLGPGEKETHKLRGSIARAAVLEFGSDANPKGVAIGDNTHVEINGSLVLRECDFSKMTVGTPVTYGTELSKDEAARPRVYLRDCRFATMPVAIAAITVGASPFEYRNMDTYREQVAIRGGTVTKVEVSRDKFATSKELNPATAVVVLDSGDSVRVTYTAAPTMHKTELG